MPLHELSAHTSIYYMHSIHTFTLNSMGANTNPLSCRSKDNKIDALHVTLKECVAIYLYYKHG